MIKESILNLRNTGISVEEYELIKPIIDKLNKGLNPIKEYTAITNALNLLGKSLEYLRTITSKEFYSVFINIMRHSENKQNYNINFIKIGTWMKSVPIKYNISGTDSFKIDCLLDLIDSN